MSQQGPGTGAMTVAQGIGPSCEPAARPLVRMETRGTIHGERVQFDVHRFDALFMPRRSGVAWMRLGKLDESAGCVRWSG